MASVDTLLSPVILFFVLGALAAAVRSDLVIPEAMAKAMSLFLMAAIGLKGGVQVSEAGPSGEMIAAGVAGLLLSFVLPFVAFFALRGPGRLDGLNAGAVAACYGSASVVTFATASEVLTRGGLAPAGFMVAVLAIMETPAILSGMLLAQRGAQGQGRAGGHLWREVLFNGSVMLLLGAFAIGVIIGKAKYEPIAPMFTGLWSGTLCLFLLDMGLIAVRRLRDSRALTLRLGLLAVAIPLVNGFIGAVVARLLGLDLGSAAILSILAASASYIAVPAAMRLALPKADAGLYLSMSLAITFPFNIVFGIPLFIALTNALAR